MISRREFLRGCAMGGALAALHGGMASAQRKPNVLFILVDDLGWADLGCYGSTFYRTPNLDRLAERGIRFTDAYAACPVCSPTRAAIMTGKHPARLNITDWIPGKSPGDRKYLGPEDLHQLPLEEVTLAETLKQHGYSTFFAGKWHLGDEGYFPEDQGFDINKGGHHRGSPPGGYYAPYNNPKLEDGPDGEYLPDRLTDECISFIEGHQDKPFLAYLSFYTVHTPIQASKRHIAACKARAQKLDISGPLSRGEHDATTRIEQTNPDYASMVEAMDENVGRVLDTLDRLNLREDTLIVFTSDNGGLSTLPRKRLAPTSNEPLRSGKGWCYEGGIRVPLLIAGPGVARPGRTCSAPAVSMDYYPTLLEMLGLPAMPEQHRDGASLAPVLEGGDTLDRQTLYWHYPHYHGSAWRPGAAVRDGDWKLIAFYDQDKLELYNLREDPDETGNLADKNPEKRVELEAKLRRWQNQVCARMPIPNPGHTKK